MNATHNSVTYNTRIFYQKMNHVFPNKRRKNKLSSLDSISINYFLWRYVKNQGMAIISTRKEKLLLQRKTGFDKSDNLINRNYKKKKNNWLQSVDFLYVSYKTV